MPSAPRCCRRWPRPADADVSGPTDRRDIAPAWRRRSWLAAAAATGGWLASGCAELRPLRELPPDAMPPVAPREWRAAWVATVAQIDWPPKGGDGGPAARDAAIALVERAHAIGLNALILQVRPAGDALYASPLEPWSEYLTGEQGRAPQPPWDPLQTWIDEAARRGIEVHAWINPYRARHPSARGPLASPHLAVTDPDAVRRYGDQLWMDPSEPAAMRRTLAVAEDIVRRYPVAGLHIDDYFYPYPVREGELELPFPDEPAWRRFLETLPPDAVARASREDWRRDQVDALVQALHARVRAARPSTAFGVSPFGVGRPERRPPGVTGFSQYDKLFANVERWVEQGWMDYLVPQLYWPMTSAGQPFGVLLDYWRAVAPPGMPVRPGLFTSRVGAPERAWPVAEVLGQIALTRSRAGVDGHAHFSLTPLAQDREGLATALREGPYRDDALAPVRGSSVATAAMPAVRLGLGGDGAWWLAPPDDGVARVHATWQRTAEGWRFRRLAAGVRRLPSLGSSDAAAACALDEAGREGPRSGVQRA